ncbi:hypothetical protein DFQ27_004811 [Actinomortierella ambigua]|uniref:Uncharacterized protein n=1 Tax=Actinomortierella ambigua TaxID=1343610 RepID=A0A9P6U3I6_9FUNG|nr:hypothetical protein DFQ27_004811 [Actinomortierella ambigua]
MTRDLFDIPELVSKTWASHFVPLLWHSFRLCYRSSNQYLEDTRRYDRWQCFTNKNWRYDKLRVAASEAFAKNGHYIREVVVENPGALAFLASHCSNLTKLICRFSRDDCGYFVKHKNKVLAQVWELVLKSPRLHTFRLGGARDDRFQNIPWPLFSNDSAAAAQHLLHLQNLPTLRHLSVSMRTRVGLSDFCTRFPQLLEARFEIDSLFQFFYRRIIRPEAAAAGAIVHVNGVRQDDEPVQNSLKQLLLEIRSGMLTGDWLQCILERFPRLERLAIRHVRTDSSLLLDLSADPYAWAPFNDLGLKEYKDTPYGPRLRIHDTHIMYSDSEVAHLVANLPVPLRWIHYRYMYRQTIVALASHCGKTLEVVWGGTMHSSAVDDFDVRPEDMTVTIGVLLARCPRLRRVDCPRLKVHIRYIMDHPWVCCEHLELLRCTVVGIPKLSAEEKSLVAGILERQQQQQRQRSEQEYEQGLEQDQEHKGLTDEERLVLDKHNVIMRCRQALQNQVAMCPKLKYDFIVEK